MTAFLVQLPYSPWSLRARWALEHHHIDFRPVMHLPMIAEPALRAVWAVLRRDPTKLFAKATVPILVDGGELYGNSLEIAEHADAVGTDTKLIPEASRSEVLSWIDAADRMLEAGRMRLMDRLIASDAALRELLPPPLRSLGPLGIATARMSSKYVKSKYVLDPPRAAPELEAAMDAVLERVDKKIASHPYLVGDFSLADIAIAGALDMVAPRPATPLGPENRKVWTEAHLAAAHPVAMAYRDRVFAERRN